ncbi:MAG: hypothetical protein ACP5G6_05810 [Conexivisphaera sp.]
MRIYYHPTCASSHRVIRELHARGLLPRVELVKVSHVATAGVMDDEIWSVPWIAEDGRPLATDPLDPDEAAGIVEHHRARVPDDASKAFMYAVLGSLYASSLVYVHGSLRPVMSPRFVQAALRSWLGGPDPTSGVESILREEGALLSEYRGKIIRVLSYGMARMLWWSSGGESPDELPGELQVATWLLSTASIGRAGLPDRPQSLRPAVRELTEAIRGDFDRLIRRVGEEQSSIMGDEEYWRLLQQATRSP